MAEQQQSLADMTTEQAVAFLDQATQPGVKLTRTDYVIINHALQVLKQTITASPNPEVE